MEDRRWPSPRRERKRPHEHDDRGTRRVRRRSDEGDDGHHSAYVRETTPRSPRRSEHRHGHDRRDSTHLAHRGHHRHRPRHASSTATRAHAAELPCGARALSRSADFDAFRPLFASYLDIQKQMDITSLDDREVRGRWKSFVGKWNSGELAEGWYQPETFQNATLDVQGAGNTPAGKRREIHTSPHEVRSAASGDRGDRLGADSPSQDTEEDKEEGEDDDDDDYGPTLPPQDEPSGAASAVSTTPSQTKHGPGIPTLSDLTLRRELEASDRADARALQRHERKADRALQKERLAELAPRADAGTRERRLEKRRDAREANAAFARAAGGGGGGEMAEMGDADLMGGGGGGDGGDDLQEYKRLQRDTERRRTEREVRREEALRAQREEREGRIREYRAREAQTVDMLREMARSRFG
ncbi:hypothetical protein F4802DRAFT_618594 [Xylaria palmicola]|nr:hypothetical protein F4802DRAFT_618594 [Xylaria palmicola]